MPRRPSRYLPDHVPFEPTSGPDWVWVCANERVDSGKNASSRRDGPEVYRAISLVRAERQGMDMPSSLLARRDDPALYAAYDLRFGGEHRTLLELQSRVLARQSLGVVAIEMTLPLPVIEAYTSMFFRVLEWLDAAHCITYRVIQLDLNGGLSPEQFAMLSAYYHGPHSIDTLLDWYDHQREFHDVGTVEGRSREAIELSFMAQNLPKDPNTDAVLSRWLRVRARAETKLFRSQSVQEVVSENLNYLMTEAQWKTEKPLSTSVTSRCVLQQPNPLKTNEYPSHEVVDARLHQLGVLGHR